jgi:hypothetical protein
MVEDLAVAPSAVQLFVPDGCLEVFFHFGAPWRTVDEGAGALHPRAMVGGQIVRSMAIRPTGRRHVGLGAESFARIVRLRFALGSQRAASRCPPVHRQGRTREPSVQHRSRL